MADHKPYIHNIAPSEYATASSSEDDDHEFCAVISVIFSDSSLSRAERRIKEAVEEISEFFVGAYGDDAVKLCKVESVEEV